jgi:hypothetical protein
VVGRPASRLAIALATCILQATVCAQSIVQAAHDLQDQLHSKSARPVYTNDNIPTRDTIRLPEESCPRPVRVITTNVCVMLTHPREYAGKIAEFDGRVLLREGRWMLDGQQCGETVPLEHADDPDVRPPAEFRTCRNKEYEHLDDLLAGHYELRFLNEKPCRPKCILPKNTNVTVHLIARVDAEPIQSSPTPGGTPDAKPPRQQYRISHLVTHSVKVLRWTAVPPPNSE